MQILTTLLNTDHRGTKYYYFRSQNHFDCTPALLHLCVQDSCHHEATTCMLPTRGWIAFGISRRAGSSRDGARTMFAGMTQQQKIHTGTVFTRNISHVPYQLG